MKPYKLGNILNSSKSHIAALLLVWVYLCQILKLVVLDFLNQIGSFVFIGVKFGLQTKIKLLSIYSSLNFYRVWVLETSLECIMSQARDYLKFIEPYVICIIIPTGRNTIWFNASYVVVWIAKDDDFKKKGDYVHVKPISRKNLLLIMFGIIPRNSTLVQVTTIIPFFVRSETVRSCLTER